jgi:hypothetical protein
MSGNYPEFPPPTPAGITADRLLQWIRDHADLDIATIALTKDRMTVEVIWKGTPPAELQRLAAAQPVPVTFHTATYIASELLPVSYALVNNNQGVVSSAGENRHRTGITVNLYPNVPIDVLSTLQTQTDVPISFAGFADPQPLSRAIKERY